MNSLLEEKGQKHYSFTKKKQKKICFVYIPTTRNLKWANLLQSQPNVNVHQL